MSYMKKDLLPSLRIMVFRIVFKTYSAFLCQLVIMGPKLTAAMEQTSSFSSLDISKQEVRGRRTGGSLMDQMKIRNLVPKGAFNSIRLQKSGVRKGLEMERCKIPVVVHAKSGDVVGTFCLVSFRKPNAENGYGIKPFEVVITLEELLVGVFESAYVKSTMLKAFYQQLPLKTNLFVEEDILKKCLVSADTKPTILNLLDRQLPAETSKFATYLLKRLGSADMKPTIRNPFCQQLPCETKEFAKNSEDFREPIEKPVFSTAANENAGSQILDHLPSMKSVQTCDGCREKVKAKKFFDERRYGIMEKCSCVLCYGCIRKSTGNSNGVVKGPVKCPICSRVSGNVASSASWIQGKEKVEFFKEYCKIMQNLNIKETIGWTSFPARKDDMWTRVI